MTLEPLRGMELHWCILGWPLDAASNGGQLWNGINSVWVLFLESPGVHEHTHYSLTTSLPLSASFPPPYSSPSLFHFVLTYSKCIYFWNPMGPTVLQKNCWFEHVRCEKEEQPLTCRSWPGTPQLGHVILSDTNTECWAQARLLWDHDKNETKHGHF